MATFMVSEDGTYITGRFTENLSEATAFMLLDELVKLSKVAGLNKVLIDARRITVPLNTMAIYRLGLVLVERLSPQYSLAVVMNKQAEADTIFESVVAGHGLNLRYFTKLDLARAWLQQIQR